MAILEVIFPTEQMLAWVEKAKDKPRAFFVEAIQDLNEAIVMNTRYKTGNLRGSWYASLNGEPDARSGPADGGGGAVARLNAALAGIQLGDVYYAANGAEYATFVEFGTSFMSGDGNVRQTIERAAEFAEAAANRIANE